MQAEGNQIFYFGDLDYEGIGIYENLAELFNEEWKIIPFMAGYEKLLDKAVKAVSIPETKERQNRNIKNIFFSYFSFLIHIHNYCFLFNYLIHYNNY